MSLKHNPFLQKKSEPILIKKKIRIFDNPPEIQKETISVDIKTIPTDTISNRAETISVDIKTISTDIDINFDTVSDTVSNYKKIKPSLLELLILKQMVLRLENGISQFQTTQISTAVGTTLGGARNSLNRLKAKGLIENTGFQKGNRVGSTSYKINPKVFEYLRALNSSKETISKETISTDTVSETISHYSKKEELNSYLPENLKQIGVRKFHLEMFKGSAGELSELMEHFSFSIDNNEIKIANKLSLFVSLLRDGKQWISEKYLQTMNEEISKNQLRMLKFEEIKKQKKENELKEKYNEFLGKNPEFIESVKSKNKNFNISEEIIDNMSFSEWKIQNEL
jgi:hypothetical protein